MLRRERNSLSENWKIGSKGSRRRKENWMKPGEKLSKERTRNSS